MSNADKAHMQRVADWAADHGCVVCREPYAHLHHIMAGRTPGRRSGNWTVIPLCWECHEGAAGIHGDRTRWHLQKADELMMLNITLEGVYGRK